jgi:hypothetical protein
MRRRAARPQTRFLLAGLAVAGAEALLGVVALPTGLGPYLLCCAAMTAAVAVGVSRLLAAPPRRGPDGGGPGGDDEDPPPPPWWPEFDAAFRAHVREQQRSSLSR